MLHSKLKRLAPSHLASLPVGGGGGSGSAAADDDDDANRNRNNNKAAVPRCILWWINCGRCWWLLTVC